MDNHATFLPAKKLKELAESVNAPFFVYDEAGICDAHSRVVSAFSFASDFRQYFPICRTTPPQLLKLLYEIGSGVCCFDAEQLRLCAKVGFAGKEIFFAPTLANADADNLATELGCVRVISAKQTIPHCPPKHAMLVYNPSGKLMRNGTVYTSFSRMKWGMDGDELTELAEHLLRFDTQSVGIMLPACANESRAGYFPAVADALFSLAASLREKGIPICSCNLAGGIAVSSKPDTPSVAVQSEAEQIRQAAESFGLLDMPLQTVLGRFVLAPNALFLTRVAAILPHERPLIITEASADCLVDAAPLGNYHHISVLGKTSRTEYGVYDVSGSQSDLRKLFAEKRILPQVKLGNWLIFHTAGLTAPPAISCPQMLFGKDGSITAW